MSSKMALFFSKYFPLWSIHFCMRSYQREQIFFTTKCWCNIFYMDRSMHNLHPKFFFWKNYVLSCLKFKNNRQYFQFISITSKFWNRKVFDIKNCCHTENLPSPWSFLKWCTACPVIFFYNKIVKFYKQLSFF